MVSRWDPATKQVEGFGIVYLEAAAAGKPSVAAVEGGAPDAVEDGKTGILVDPASVDAVSAALRRLLSDPDGAAAMGRAGREKVRRQFTKERCLQMVEDCLMWSRRGINPETAPGAPPLSAGSRAG
jgi:phosphatidylinositol alpha-1,6-mannosyltransferase